jgi:hypothetical protein
MIKHILFIILTGTLLVFNSNLSAQCKGVKSIVKNSMSQLGPYEYDSYAVKEIIFGAKAKKETVEFSVFSGEKYKLVFSKTELPQEVGITIYDKPATRKDRKILYFDDSGKKGDFACNFQPSTTGTYYIEYSIPAQSASNQKGCFILLIGILY